MRRLFTTFLATAVLVIPLAHGQQTSKDRLEIASVFDWDDTNCNNSDVLIDFTEEGKIPRSTLMKVNGDVSDSKFCNPQASENLNKAVEVGMAGLSVLLNGSEKLPVIGYAVTTLKSIYGYVCSPYAEDSGAILDYKKVQNIATEIANKEIVEFINKKIEKSDHTFDKKNIQNHIVNLRG